MDAAVKSLLERLDRLSDEFRELRDGVHMAVDIAARDPEMALTRSRKMLEYVIRDVYQRRIEEPPGTRPLENLVQRLVKDGFFPSRLDAYANTIRKLGNVGTHTFGQKITNKDVYQSLTQLMAILEWYVEVERPEALSPGAVPPGDERPRVSPAKPASEAAGDYGGGARVAVVPKGLRSFDAKDADFFLDLLPGPRDQGGLPESIRFWKHRIEDKDETTFTVGVIYGPSGCGKSSLVKAGLLPRLDLRVLAVYVEATAEYTEPRLLSGLRKRCPDLPKDLDLIATTTALREGHCLPPGAKVLLVLDQFEQWLHARRAQDNTALAQALRQCDGEHVQCIILVRDDFWLALSRFMQALRIELVQGQNLALVDLFDVPHARQVLAAFGCAFGRLSDPVGKEQEVFLERAVAGLARDGRVISVRLALFAEMVKGKPWTAATLREVGGTEGVGVAFLEETFVAASAPFQHRTHAQAAQAVLRVLLPEAGTEIKGHMRSHEELLAASGYAGRAKDFAELLRILDGELRLITPTEAAGSAEGQYYQLTHDYLVPSVRDWLTRKQKETRRGRAELELADRAVIWNSRPGSRQLPSLPQWLQIRCWTRKQTWTPPQRKMMRKATRYHARRAFVAASLLIVLVWGLYEAYGTLQAHDLQDRLLNANTLDVPAVVADMAPYRRWLDPLLHDAYAQAAASKDEHGQLLLALALVAVDDSQVEYLHGRLLDAKPEEVPVIRDFLAPYKAKLVDGLWSVVEKPAKGKEHQRLRAAAALASYNPDSPRWDQSSGNIVDDLVSEDALYLGIWSAAFGPVKERLIGPLAAIYRDAQPERAAQRSLATSLLADYAAGQPLVLADLLMDADDKQFAVIFGKLKNSPKAPKVFDTELNRLELTKPVPLLQIKATLSDQDSAVKVNGAKDVAALAAKRYLVPLKAGKVCTMTMTSSDLDAFLVLQDKAGTQLADDDDSGGGTNAFLAFVAPADGEYQVYAASVKGTGAFTLDIVEVDARQDAKEKLAKRQANAAVALLRLGQADKVWPLLKRDPDRADDCRLRSYLIHRLGPLGADPAAISQRLQNEPDVTIRRALILSLGPEEFGKGAFSSQAKKQVMGQLQGIYGADADPGMHAAAAWLLRQWREEAWLKQTDDAWAKDKEQRDQQFAKVSRAAAAAGAKPQWCVNGQGHTLVLIPGPVEFLMGSPVTEAGREGGPEGKFETQHKKKIGRSFAIGAKEVTVGQFRAFYKTVYHSEFADSKQYSPTDDCPVNTVTWYLAAQYCNWLSDQERIDKNQWCYEPNDQGQYAEGMKLSPDYLALTGYRLPSEAEWEYACRAGALTSRYYGESEELLGKYAWYAKNSLDRGMLPGVAGQRGVRGDSLKPNDLGLFDMLGNALEWCQESFQDYVGEEDKEDKRNITDPLSRVLRGGSFHSQASVVRCANRVWTAPTNRGPDVGFRPARTFR
jgi:formylglycine-generating enzyme required for sulfatase activity